MNAEARGDTNKKANNNTVNHRHQTSISYLLSVKCDDISMKNDESTATSARRPPEAVVVMPEWRTQRRMSFINFLSSSFFFFVEIANCAGSIVSHCFFLLIVVVALFSCFLFQIVDRSKQQQKQQQLQAGWCVRVLSGLREIADDDDSFSDDSCDIASGKKCTDTTGYVSSCNGKSLRIGTI